MEFKETKVGTLDKEDKALLKRVLEAGFEAERAAGKAHNLAFLLWEHLARKHGFPLGGHFIRGNSIYKESLE